MLVARHRPRNLCEVVEIALKKAKAPVFLIVVYNSGGNASDNIHVFFAAKSIQQPMKISQR